MPVEKISTPNNPTPAATLPAVKEWVQCEIHKEALHVLHHALEEKKIQLAPPLSTSLQQETLPLPDEFYDLIINKYMGNQEKILQFYAEVLYMGNTGSGFFRDLKSILGSDWSTANLNNIFDMDTWVKNHPAATPEEIKAHATEELNKLKEMSDNAGKAADQVQKDIEALDKDPTYNKPENAAKKKELMDALKASKAELLGKQQQIDELRKSGGNLDKISKDGITKDRMADIAKLENFCVNGDSSKGIPGMNQAYSNLNAAQERYSYMGTSAQLQLMSTMTAVQQEWTLVANSLQSLNQMYMACARGIHS